MVKYKTFYNQMETENEVMFNEFQKIHDGYKTDKKAFSKEFHEKGRDVLDVMRDWDRRLCGGMERGVHSQYSNKLSEKFWGEIKKRFSHIELVGVKSNLE